MTKEQLIELVKFTAGEIVAPTTLNNEDAESILDDFVNTEQLTIPVIMSCSLTAENGAKAHLMGEFFEEIEVPNEEYCGCGECDYCIDFPDTEETITQKVPLSWTTIKEIYAKIVSHYGT